MAPAPGKYIAIEGTSLSQSTDANGQALFTLPAGSYLVLAYGVGAPGPIRDYIGQNVVVETAHTSRVQFNDCTMCR
mgnify:FL=1